ncbi:MAG: glycogen debranching enzyme N-terminal domain-containing protein, partial [Bacteroidota bacterium]
MSYLYFDKDHLVNLHFSLTDEFIETNRVGCYSSSSIVLCNTRKYHGLLIAPVDQFKGERHVLLSAMDETIIQHGQEFHLGTHQYPNDVIEPDGAKYLWEFTFEENPKWLIRVGGVLLEKEIFLSLEEARLFVRYTLVEAHSQTRLQLKPYLAFRNIHSLTKGNMDVNTRSMKCKNGISVKLYNGFPRLYMQLSRKNEFVSSPDWYYNIEYTREFERGYESNEDLFVPGFFEAELKKGETLTFTAGLSELAVQNISRKANHEKNKKNDRQDMVSTLKASAENFITSLNNQQEVIAGFYWFAQWGRDSLIALAELTLNQGRTSDFFAVIDDLAAQMKNGLMPNAVFNKKVTYNAIDTPFWFIWAIQQYVIRNENQKKWIWENYGNVIETIFKHFMNGTDFNIHIKENGLVYGGEKGVALTWMDAMIDDQPVTPRAGAPVEVNALWYNAIVFALDLAGKSDDKKFISKYERWPEIVSESFIDCFWDEEKGYL